jgi:S1-C subfamily serine protease
LLQKLGQNTAGVLSASLLAMNGLMPPVAYGVVQEAPPPIVLTAEERSTVKLFKENTPSVVYVTNLATVGTLNSDFMLNLTEIPRGAGSGFVWDTKGHIVTNYHVIQGASDLKITTIDQSAYRAKVIGFDEDKDVAVLEVTDKEAIGKLRPVKAGTCRGLLVGQTVLAIGNPFGLDHTLTQGIISGLGRVITAENGRPITGVIQTDAAINPGNSGGPLLDSAGNVIGINSAILDPTGQGSSSGVGFAIPIDIVRSVVDQLLQYGRVLRPVLGITIAPDATLQSLREEGVLVLDVPAGSPADLAGLRKSERDEETGRLILGDIIIELEGRKISNSTDLFTAVDDFKPGDKVSLTVIRAQGYSDKPTKLKLQVTLGERPSDTMKR